MTEPGLSSRTNELELDDYTGIVAGFELSLLITAVLFGLFLMWWCALSSERSGTQPTRYVYSGDTVATDDDDDEREECDEEQTHRPKLQQSVKSIIRMTGEIVVCVNRSNDGDSDVVSVASMVLNSSDSCDSSDRDSFDIPV